MSFVPVVIPFFREHEKLKKCLAAIEAQTSTCEPFVRDNTHDNILFTAAVNEGLAKYAYRADVRYVMVLNQDAYLKRDCVQELVAFMDAHPQCAIACPLQIAERTPAMAWGGQGKPLVVSAQAPAVTWGGSLQAFPVGVHRQGDFASYVQPVETPWANGACMLLRTQALREIGLLDKNMRFICSDADISFTARARGWQVFVVPKALVEHSLGASGQQAPNPELELVKLKDIVYFAEKWLDGGLYRRLAHEGPNLTRSDVRRVLRTLRHSQSSMERDSGGARPAAGLRFPDWLFELVSDSPPNPFRRQA